MIFFSQFSTHHYRKKCDQTKQMHSKGKERSVCIRVHGWVYRWCNAKTNRLNTFDIYWVKCVQGQRFFLDNVDRTLLGLNYVYSLIFIIFSFLHNILRKNYPFYTRACLNIISWSIFLIQCFISSSFFQK